MSEDKQTFDTSSVVPDGILAEKLKHHKGAPMTRPSDNYPDISLNQSSPFLKRTAPVPAPSVNDVPQNVPVVPEGAGEEVTAVASESMGQASVPASVSAEAVPDQAPVEIVVPAEAVATPAEAVAPVVSAAIPAAFMPGLIPVTSAATQAPAEATSVPQVQQQPEAQAQPQPQPQVQPQTQVQPQFQAQPESQAQAQPQSQPQAQVQHQAQPQAQVQPEPEPVSGANTVDISDLDITAKDALYRQLRAELGESDYNEDLSSTSPPLNPVRVDNENLVTISRFPRDMITFFETYIDFLVGDDENLRASLKGLSRTKLLQAICVSMSAGGIVTDDQVVIAAARVLSANQLNSVMLMNNIDRLRSVVGNIFTDVRKMSKTVGSVQNVVEANSLLNAYHLGFYLDVLPRNEVNMPDGVTPRYDHPVSLKMVDTTKQLAAKQLQIEKDREGRNFRRNDRRG